MLPLKHEAVKIMCTAFYAMLLSTYPSENACWELMAQEFQRQFPDHDVKDPKRTLFKNMFHKLLAEGHCEDLPRGGRPTKAKDSQVDACIHALKRGLRSKNRTWIGFSSLEDAAKHSHVIQQVVKNANVTLRTLWRRMVKRQIEIYDHHFKKITITVKPKLSPKVKAQRLQAAKIWAKWSLSKLRRVVWIDEKQEYIGRLSYRCYADDDASSFIMEGKEALNSSKKIKYIAAVSAILGPVYFSTITGTTGLSSKYKVRTCVPLL